MPNQRVFLWLALGALLFLNYESWMRDFAPPVSPSTQAAPPSQPAASRALTESVPNVSGAREPAQGASAASAQQPSQAPPASTFDRHLANGDDAGRQAIHVRTDVLDLTIDSKGAELSRADLLHYPVHKNQPDVLVRLFDRSSDSTFYVLQTGLSGNGESKQPNHLAEWSTGANEYVLAPGASELSVPFTWSDDTGLKVSKIFVFRRGSYSIDLRYEVHNGSDHARKLASYAQLVRHWDPASRSYFDVETYAFKGPAIFDGVRYRKLNVQNDDDAKYAGSVTNGWLASMQHHFVSAIVPHANQAYDYQLRVVDRDYLLGATGPVVNVPSGADAKFTERLFSGPKLQDQLEAAGPRLELTADYGKLTVIAKPLFTALKWIHGLVGNWGWAIIIVTALIKLAFYPLSQASGRSMAKMRSVGPRMKQIQENYKEDREKLGRAMMELYKKEKINPVAGCLPMLVQIPVFISFYWVLLESVEMRQAPFMLWINDLSVRDPFFVLPLLMGGAMFAQFKLNPPPPDPTQAKIMQFMPLVMTAMMAWFPAGLVLYWLTNTLLSIAQQWRVNDVVTREAAKLRS